MLMLQPKGLMIDMESQVHVQHASTYVTVCVCNMYVHGHIRTERTRSFHTWGVHSGHLKAAESRMW